MVSHRMHLCSHAKLGKGCHIGPRPCVSGGGESKTGLGTYLGARKGGLRTNLCGNTQCSIARGLCPLRCWLRCTFLQVRAPGSGRGSGNWRCGGCCSCDSCDRGCGRGCSDVGDGGWGVKTAEAEVIVSTLTGWGKDKRARTLPVCAPFGVNGAGGVKGGEVGSLSARQQGYGERGNPPCANGAGAV
jgi:hypothetical protein